MLKGKRNWEFSERVGSGDNRVREHWKTGGGSRHSGGGCGVRTI